MEILRDPIFLRGVERLAIVLCAVVFAWLGFRLFRLGIDKGLSTFSAHSKLFRLTFSGTGPGLLFMAFGALVLMTGLYTGGAEVGSDNIKILLREREPGSYMLVPGKTFHELGLDSSRFDGILLHSDSIQPQ